MAEIAYRCWCDGSACSNPTAEPFTVCDECKSFGHQALPSGGLQPDDVRLNTETDVSTSETPRVAHRLAFDGRRRAWIVERVTTEVLFSHPDFEAADRWMCAQRSGAGR